MVARKQMRTATRIMKPSKHCDYTAEAWIITDVDYGGRLPQAMSRSVHVNHAITLSTSNTLRSFI